MTKEKDKASGEIARITSWKTGKGYFLNLDDNNNDFYGFGACKAKVGETVELEVSEGTGNFADKVKIDKMYSKVTAKQAGKEIADKDMEIVKKSIESGERTYFERQELIVRQTCIKAAARVVAALIMQKQSCTKKNLVAEVAELADGFYGFVTCRDEKLPEPPEEP